MPIDGRSAHAIERAAQRYGLELGVVDIEVLESEMAAGRLMVLRRQEDGEVVAVARVQGHLCVIAFDPVRGRVKSFLPHSAMRRASSYRYPRREYFTP